MVKTRRSAVRHKSKVIRRCSVSVARSLGGSAPFQAQISPFSDRCDAYAHLVVAHRPIIR